MTNAQKILTLNAFDAKDRSNLDPEAAQPVERRQKTFGPTSMLFYKRPLNIVRAEGVWLYDADGRRYLDAYNNVPSVGHCHPHVVQAVSRQIATLNTHTRYLYENVYTYAERLLATFPAEVSNVVFTCTGSESVDLALRIARSVTGGKGFIATANAYHGNTTTATEVSPSSASAEPTGPHIELVAAPDTFREPNGAAERRFVADVAAAIENLESRGIKVAGMIADSILSSDGVYPGVPGYLNEAAALVRRAGGLYIADEVQPGFARTGAAMWGFMRHGIVPDLVVMGKPMGNGFPIGALVAKPDILAEFGKGSGYFNTFGGSPVAAAAGMAVLDVIENDGLMENARETGEYLMAGARALQARHRVIGDVRGAGLYIGIEFVKADGSGAHDRDLAVRTMNGLRERGVLGGTAGIQGNVWKVRPPLCFRREHADLLLAALDAELTEQAR